MGIGSVMVLREVSDCHRSCETSVWSFRSFTNVKLHEHWWTFLMNSCIDWYLVRLLPFYCSDKDSLMTDVDVDDGNPQNWNHVFTASLAATQNTWSCRDYFNQMLSALSRNIRYSVDEGIQSFTLRLEHAKYKHFPPSSPLKVSPWPAMKRLQTNGQAQGIKSWNKTL